VWSSVVWASLTSVASYPRANAPWSVERMHASVCAPTTTSRPTARPDSTVSRVVSSKASPYAFSTCGSASSGASSGTIRQLSLPRTSPLVGVLHPDDGDVFTPRLLDEAADVRDDRIALVRALDDAVLHVDDEERGVRPVGERAQGLTSFSCPVCTS
jgi:hypothetical protein